MSDGLDSSGAASAEATAAVRTLQAAAEEDDRMFQQNMAAAVVLAHADMGTLQRYDPHDDCLHIVASRAFSKEAREFFAIVRRETNSTCAAAFFVEDISESYLFVGTRELDFLRAMGIAAAQSMPLISSGCWAS